MNATELRTLILNSLRQQGFEIENGCIRPLASRSKDEIRHLHALSITHRREKARPALERYESALLRRFAEGTEFNPEKVSPTLIEVKSGSEDEKLFRYAALQWSIPVSNGYGRRIRFIVVDRHNDKLIGIIGLGDPVYSLRDRDKWIGWSPEIKRERLRNVMDAFVLGAVQPYSQLLCGKLVAMLVASTEVRRAIENKYSNRVALISKQQSTGRIALITTLSGLGRSSIYNRVTDGKDPIYYAIGYSSGSGDFQFSNGTYKALFDYATENCQWSAKNALWGTGSRNRREVVRKALQHLGLREDLLYHGINRQIFAIPLAENTREFLRGHDSALHENNSTVSSLFDFFKRRWLLPRMNKDAHFTTFRTNSLALWTK